MFDSSVIFTLKNYITFVLISVLQTESINKEFIMMTLTIRKSPVFTLVLVVPPYFSPPLGKVKWKRERIRNNMGRKSTFSLYVCVDLFSTTRIKRNNKKEKVVKIHSFF